MVEAIRAWAAGHAQKQKPQAPPLRRNQKRRAAHHAFPDAEEMVAFSRPVVKPGLQRPENTKPQARKIERLYNAVAL